MVYHWWAQPSQRKWLHLHGAPRSLHVCVKHGTASETRPPLVTSQCMCPQLCVEHKPNAASWKRTAAGPLLGADSAAAVGALDGAPAGRLAASSLMMLLPLCTRATACNRDIPPSHRAALRARLLHSRVTAGVERSGLIRSLNCSIKAVSGARLGGALVCHDVPATCVYSTHCILVWSTSPTTHTVPGRLSRRRLFRHKLGSCMRAACLIGNRGECAVQGRAPCAALLPRLGPSPHPWNNITA